jgi:hypothetical protein
MVHRSSAHNAVRPPREARGIPSYNPIAPEDTMPQPRMIARCQRHPAALAWLGLAILAVAAAPAVAAVTSYTATLSGAAESPPNASPGAGFAQVDIDPVAHTMRVLVSFEGLQANVTNAHIHGPTAVAGTGTAGVATTTPTFPGFPAGVTAGVYDVTFDMTQASSFNASFITANGGTPATAEAALFAAIDAGKAYVNVHSTLYPGGEIRGFLESMVTPTEASNWGGVKSLFR